LISPYINATRLFHSLDAANIRPLKLGWKTAELVLAQAQQQSWSGTGTTADLEWHRQNSRARVAQAQQQI